MGQRRKSREFAMQALFYMDMTNEFSIKSLNLFSKNFSSLNCDLDFFSAVIKGVIDSKEQIDNIIKKHSTNWKIERMTYVDRNILRIGIYELLFCDDIPAKVTINEAIDIGKKFGAEDSGSFINAVLDKIKTSFNKKKILDEF
jgi:N utilization substance protein B